MEINSLEQCCRKKTSRFRESGAYGGGGQEGYLPEWFLFELLPRLPIKSVFRFKCVSKQWLSFITHPSFPSLYLSRAPGQFAYFLPKVRLEDDDEDSLLPYLKFPEAQWLTLPTSLKGETAEEFYVRAADKGFLLVGKRYVPNQFYVCNAMTNQWLTLPILEHNFLYLYGTGIDEGLITQVEDGILTSYKVMFVLSLPSPGRRTLDLQIFSSETGRWVGFRAHPERPVEFSWWGRQGKILPNRPILLNNTLHWTECWPGRLLAYDPYASPGKYSIIDLPGDARGHGGVCQGRLKWFEITAGGDGNESKILQIWELQGYHGQISSNDHDHQHYHWCLQHRIRIADIMIDERCHFAIYYLSFVSFHPFDPDVIYLRWGKGESLLSFNIPTRRMELLTPGRDLSVNWLSPFDKCFFLVLPTRPISIPHSLCRGGDEHADHL